MRYSVEYTKTALKQLKKMDRKIVSFIVAYIEDKLVDCEDPRRYGKALQRTLNDKWRYRVGDYRILAKIQDDIVVITLGTLGISRIEVKTGFPMISCFKYGVSTL